VEVSPEDEAIVGKQIIDTLTLIRNKKFEGCGKEDCPWCQK
jgi:hypothetical protein